MTPVPDPLFAEHLVQALQMLFINEPPQQKVINKVQYGLIKYKMQCHAHVDSFHLDHHGKSSSTVNSNLTSKQLTLDIACIFDMLILL